MATKANQRAAHGASVTAAEAVWTGTAQHAEGRPPHAWFTAFAPAQDPVVAVAVVVEDGGAAGDEASGGRTAAPVAREVIQARLDQLAAGAAEDDS